MPRENLLTVQCEVVRNVGLLELDGELIAESRFEPERVLREWHDDGIVRVIVGCAGLRHIDSAGFSILLGALHRFRRQKGDLLLAGMNPTLNAMFEATSMEKYFNIFPSLQAARHHFKQLEPPPKPARKRPVKIRPKKRTATRKAGGRAKRTAK